jgi:hypothetical protein
MGLEAEHPNFKNVPSEDDIKAVDLAIQFSATGE